MQRRAAPVILDGADAVIASETGSGKTLAFLLPLLSRLHYPPLPALVVAAEGGSPAAAAAVAAEAVDGVEGPQLLVLVPTRELGVQVVMLVYRLFGGSVNPGIPGGCGMGGRVWQVWVGWVGATAAGDAAARHPPQTRTPLTPLLPSLLLRCSHRPGRQHV